MPCRPAEAQQRSSLLLPRQHRGAHCERIQAPDGRRWWHQHLRGFGRLTGAAAGGGLGTTATGGGLKAGGCGSGAGLGMAVGGSGAGAGRAGTGSTGLANCACATKVPARTAMTTLASRMPTDIAAPPMGFATAAVVAAEVSIRAGQPESPPAGPSKRWITRRRAWTPPPGPCSCAPRPCVKGCGSGNLAIAVIPTPGMFGRPCRDPAGTQRRQERGRGR